MKLLLATLLCLLTFASAHAQAWPRNPKTGKVEFRGSLPWPASVKTEAQRRALVRRWYLAKLTDSTPAEVEAQAATNKTNGLLTYAKLPQVTGLQYGQGDNSVLLSYFARFSPSTKGLGYQIGTLSFTRLGDVETSESIPLEQFSTATPSEQAALAALRKRLAVALAHW